MTFNQYRKLCKGFSERRMRCAFLSGHISQFLCLILLFLTGFLNMPSCFEASLECHQASTTELIFCKRHGALVRCNICNVLVENRDLRCIFKVPVTAQVADFVKVSTSQVGFSFFRSAMNSLRRIDFGQFLTFGNILLFGRC